MNEMSFTLAIPTYKRPLSLKRALNSVLSSTRLPSEVLVIDDDVVPEDLVSEMLVAFDKKGVSFQYYKKDHNQIRRGLSESKNWATSLASHKIIFFLDDDVVLEPDYFLELMKVWEKNWSDKNFIGAGGRVINNRKTGRLENLYRRVFGLKGELNWDVNDIGFQVWDEGVFETEKSHYIHGGVSSYRKSFLEKNPFATFSGGRTGLEDVEHCLRAKRAGYFFYYVPSAALYHYPKPMGREHAFISGKKESANRKEIFIQHCHQNVKHRIWFFWANLGWIIKKTLGLRFREAVGLITGLM